MDMRGYQHYREDSLNTMTPGELLLRVYDELVKRLTQAEFALSKEDYPTFEAAVDHSVRIIHYLDDTLDRQYEISHQLARLYEYFCYELSRVKSGRNKTELERVKRMAGELRESFRAADKNTSTRLEPAMLCDQDFTTATAIQRQMYTALNEVAELTDQLSQAVDRQDQVAVRMFLSMRLEEIQRLTGYQALLDRQCDQLAPEDRGLLTQMNSGRFGGEAPSPSAQALLRQAQRNRAVLERVRRVDEAVSRRLGGNSSFYVKNSQ